MAIADRLRRLRKQRKLSQEQLAVAARTSSGMIGDIERGQRDPRLSLLRRIADALHVALFELLD